MAINSEDYEAAKIIKVEIEKLKQAAMYPSFQNPQFPPQFYGQGMNSVVGSGIGMTQFGLGDQAPNYGIPMGG